MTNVQANPAFTRKYELSCNACHTAWPNLTDYGRAFKENGFRLEPGHAAPEHLQKIDEKTWLEKFSFIAAKINGRLYDKQPTQDRARLRAFHELEVYLAGHASDQFSYLAVIEAEDEVATFDVDGDEHADAAFNLFVDTAMIGWHPREEANVALGWGSIFSADPYNTLADNHRRLTRSHKAPLDMSFTSSFALRKATQFVTFYGRSHGVYYSASVGTGNDDSEGTDDKDFVARVAYDFPLISVGGFYLDGTNDDGISPGIDQDFTRLGVDFQLEANGFSAYGVYLKAEDDAAGGDVSNDAAYVEALYVFERKGQPLLFPLIRWETFESNDGADSNSAVAAVVGWFCRPNINLNLEYWKETSVPGGGDKGSRTTLFFNIGV